MLMPVLFVAAFLWGNDDSRAFVTTFGAVPMPFGTALWSIAIWRRRERPWLTFFITATVILVCIKLHAYEVGVR